MTLIKSGDKEEEKKKKEEKARRKLKNQQMIDAILNKRISETHPDCAADCLSLTQYESVFPLHGEESKLDVPLNKFSLKYIFVFTDHLSIYKDPQQKMLDLITSPPKQSDFLNDYPIDSYLQPCKNGFSICFIQQYIDEVITKRNASFKVIDEIKGTFGEMYPKKCIILQQELIQNGDQVQVLCHQDLGEITRLFFQINNLIDKQGQDDTAGRVFMVKETLDGLQEMDIFLDHKVFTGNNKGGGPLEDIQELPDFVSYFTFSIDSDLMIGSAYTMVEAGDSEKLQWKGDKGKKPADSRCFGIKIKTSDEKNNRRFFCIFSNSLGTSPLDDKLASLQAYEWVIKLNKAIKKAQKKKTMMKISKAQELSASDVNLIESEVHVKASIIDKKLTNMVSENLIEDSDVKEIKKQSLSEMIDGLCGGDKKCMANIATDIAGGKLPLSDSAAASAWSPDNPYKVAAVAKAEEAENQNGKGDDIRSIEGGAEQKVESTTLEGKKDETQLGFNTAPEGQIDIKSIMKALNTFKFILQGKNIDDLATNGPKFCEPEDPNSNIYRSIGLMPFLAKMDPWLEYLGYVRDIQSNA